MRDQGKVCMSTPVWIMGGARTWQNGDDKNPEEREILMNERGDDKGDGWKLIIAFVEIRAFSSMLKEKMRKWV